MGLPRFTLVEIRKHCVTDKLPGEVHGQVEGRTQKQTRDAKPYLEVQLRDGTGLFTFRVWQDHESYPFLLHAAIGTFLGVTGEFSISPQYGLEVRNYVIRALGPEEVAGVVDGPATLREKQASDFRYVEEVVTQLRDPRLRRLAELFLGEFGERFRRTAGARYYHHARRGGLVEHVAQMLRTARAFALVYPQLNADLLCCGVLFHDCGKMWENCFPKDGLLMAHDTRGELVGHITIGIEVVNRLWNRLRSMEEYSRWHLLTPDSESVHLHLLHLVAAHHGEKSFGSPVEPKTPEAVALHFIDNLDARLETMAAAYETGNRLSEDIIEKVRPLSTNVVTPLPAVVDTRAGQKQAAWLIKREAYPADLPFDLPLAP
ncbi:MAG TPA: HD domain-containing protein [Chthoniobacterales bacterium]